MGCFVFDNIANSIREAVKGTERRRKIQMVYNWKHGVVPKSIVKPIKGRRIEIKNVKSISWAKVKNVIIGLEAE